MYDLIFFATLLIVAFFWGGHVERRHYASIKEREGKLPRIPVINFDRNNFPHDVASVKMVTGNTVIAADYFKTILSQLVSVFGGNIAVLESVLDRGRREALVRMKQQALDADFIANLRLETTTLSAEGGREMPKVEVYAYATAVYLKK